MNSILKELGNSPKINSILKDIKQNKSPIAISGLSGVLEAEILAYVIENIKRPILLVTYNEIQAQRLVEDLKFFTDKVVFLPKKEIVTYDYVAESKNLPYERIDVLNKIYRNQSIIVVTGVETIKQQILPKEVLYKNTLNFKISDRCDLEKLKQKLVDLGYERFELIDGRGEFSIRGDIIDISISDTEGIRIELWGDEVDSIRKFNIVSQRSKENLESVQIFPAHEYILESSIDDVIKNIEINELEQKNKLNISKENSTTASDLSKIYEKIEEDIEQIQNGNYISKIDRYFNSFYKRQETLLEYLGENALIFVDELNKGIQRSKQIEEDVKNTIYSIIEKEKIVPNSLQNYIKTDDLLKKFEEHQTIYLDKLDNIYKSNIERYNLNCKEINYFKTGINLFIEDIKNFQKQNKNIYIIADTKEKAGTIEKLLKENEIQSSYQEELNQTIIKKQTKTVTITLGKISSGFMSSDINEIVINGEGLVDSPKHTRTYKNDKFKQGEKIVFADLKIGDYVVHRKYGIGIYIGVNTLTADGITRDYIKIKYLDDDILYIPTNSLDEIRKYVGGGENNLRLNKLGSKDWEKTTSKVKKNLRAVAKELIELYARREKSKGFAFSKDSQWQSQFEDTFPYVETDDQLRSIEEVKKDMESDKPMDRLLCGDVGYGKTEIALRAAFKAVMDQKQVAYLAPTTILSKQQYETFKERMKDFPIRIELLNRFKSTKDQNRIIRELKLRRNRYCNWNT